jgi:hypothetical protein
MHALFNFLEIVSFHSFCKHADFSECVAVVNIQIRLGGTLSWCRECGKRTINIQHIISLFKSSQQQRKKNIKHAKEQLEEMCNEMIFRVTF